MDVVIPEAYLLIVSENGYGKLTPIAEYKQQSRGGLGIKTLKVTDKTGKVSAAKLVNQSQQLMLVSKDGKVISTPVKDEDGSGIRVVGRNTQGVIIMSMDEGDNVAAIAAWE
jgi:DNA gyrase subunit A